MDTKRKGRAGYYQATSNTAFKPNFTPTTYRIKAVIRTLALWGWFPLGLADWITHRRGQRDD